MFAKKEKYNKPRRKLIESFDNAIEGFIYVLRNQSNMRIHFVIAFVSLIAAVLLGFDLNKILVLLIAIFIVFFAEAVNTVIGHMLNAFEEKNKTDIKIIKDISASIVLISCILSVVIGYLLFIPLLSRPLANVLNVLKFSSWHVTFICLVTVISLVILGKVFFRKGRPLRGGMPSGHSAFAFSVWTITALIQENIIITMLVFILAVLVVRSRMANSVHTMLEVIAGSFLGFFVTLLFFQLFII